MGKYDQDARAEALLIRIGAVRRQIMGFVGDLDAAGVVPGFLPPGALEALAEAEAALSQTQEHLLGEEVGAEDLAAAEAALEQVQGHVTEVEQELWAASVKLRRPR